MASRHYHITSEGSNFVSGSRPSASIKTAVIRPTNFYDGRRRSSSGMSPDSSKTKLAEEPNVNCLKSHSDNNSTIPEVSVFISEEAANNPLSDTSAIMYGTNATCRRKSKVEAWIESSSSAHSEESITINQLSPELHSPIMRLPPLSPSNLSHCSNRDLSFENLCQELLALSASCTTLEQMINNTQAEISKSNNKDINGKTSCKHSVASRDNINIKCQPETSRSSTPPPPPLPPRRKSSLNAVEKHSQALHKSEILFVPSQGWQTSNQPSSKQVKSIIVPADKLTALTVDVGPRYSKHSRVSIPVKDSLVTVTSPQLFYMNGQRIVKEHPTVRPTLTQDSIINSSSNACKPALHVNQQTSKQQRVTGRDQHSSPKSHNTDNSSSSHRMISVKEDNSTIVSVLYQQVDVHDKEGINVPCIQVNCTSPISDTDKQDKLTDHVAAAITTKPIANVCEMSTHQTPNKLHRSFSEPSTFVTLTPYKRLNLVRTPSKRDSKNKPSSKIGMDFIRRNNSSNGKILVEGSATNISQSITSPSKDNLLTSNLDNHLSKVSTSATSKLTLPDTTIIPPLVQTFANRQDSIGSDSVFEKDIQNKGGSLPPYTSTVKSQQSFTLASRVSHESNSGLMMAAHMMTNKSSSASNAANESLSSSFESEALDFLASLKSSKQYNKHGKFPVDVDPITGSPRQQTSHHKAANTQHQMKSFHGTSSCSTRSSCLNSPSVTGSSPFVYPKSPQTPVSRRSRQSYYDNVIQSSPYCGLRMSVESGSSSGTVFSRPWGDLSKWEEYFHCSSDFRHRVDSAFSYQGQSLQNENDCGHLNHMNQHLRGSCGANKHKDPNYHSPAPVCNQEMVPHLHVCNGVTKHPKNSLPDVALQASSVELSPSTAHARSTWELALDRAINRVRSYTKLLHTDHHNCEITRHTHQLLSDSRTFPGELVGRFLTCTWETNPVDVNIAHEINRDFNSNKTNSKSSHTTKTDWYSSNIQTTWSSDLLLGKYSLPYTTQAYANDGYLLNTYSKDTCRSAENALSSGGTKEHRVLSNVRQFIDGMKRYLLNQPDTQMMFAIQRERVKLVSDQFINLDAIMEAVLEKVILLPLSDHLLNVITSNADYTVRHITKLEGGMKTIVLHRNELFAHLEPSISALDGYEQTLRSAFQSMKSEFSPLSKLQFLLQTALLIILVHNKASSHKQHDLALLFIYTMACYGDATLIVHLAYIRHLIPHSLRSGATAYVFSLFEICAQVFDRITAIPPTLNHRTMILCEILDKLSCQVIVADESTNQVLRRNFALSKYSTVSEMTEILNVDTGNHDVKNYQLYLIAEDKEILLRPRENLCDILMSHTHTDESCAVVFRRPNTQMLLPRPK